MEKKLTRLFVFLISLSFTLFWLYKGSCFEPVRAFYFWENNRISLNSYEKKTLSSLSVQKLYVKLFEVEKNDVLGIFPSAKSNLEFTPVKGQNLDIIPTVYVRNEVFKNVDTDELSEFADNLLFLIDKRYAEQFPKIERSYSEIQIDCDWTESTKNNYFIFLKELKEKSDVEISATLRLYAYKFPEKMGVLPVDRAMLMCYNLLTPLEAGNRNSILDLNELQKYLVGSDTYPLPLDVALPIYSSVQIYQNDQLMALFYKEDKQFLKSMKHQKGRWYTMKKDTVVPELFIRKSDLVKYEHNSPKELRKAIDIIRSNVSLNSSTTVALYHLEEFELKKYTNEELHTFYN